MKHLHHPALGRFLTLFLVAGGVAHAQLEVRVFNHTSYTNADFIYLLPSDTQSGTNFNISYGGTNQMQTFQSTALSALPFTTATNSPGYRTFTIGYSSSLAMYFGLNNSANPWVNTNSSTATPSFTGGPATGWSQTPFGSFEASYTNGIQDNADATAINSVGIPMKILMANSSGTISQSGFTNTAQIPTMNTQLNTIPGVAWLGAGPNTNVIRYIGPNQAPVGSLLPPSGGATGTNAANPQVAFPAFTDYIAATEARTNATKIAGQISYKLNGQTNWQYNYDFNMTVTNGAVQLTGNMTATNTLGAGSFTATNLTASIAGDVNTTNNAFLSSYIYAAPASMGGATTNSGSLYTNSPVGMGQIQFSAGWEQLANDTGLDYYQFFTPNISDHVLGDVSFGFAGGFINSSVLSTNGVTPIGDLTSSEWFNQGMIFGGLQTNDTFYSKYAATIFDATTSVYAHPYGDRMQNVYPNSIPLTNGAGSWFEVHLYDPLAIPEPVTAVACVIGVIGFALFKSLRKRASAAS